jgi:hypothetical protein
MTTGVKGTARVEIDLLPNNSYILAYVQMASDMREKITNENFQLAMKAYNFENIEVYSFNNILSKVTEVYFQAVLHLIMVTY